MVFNKDILALNISDVAKPLTKRGGKTRFGREAAEKSDNRHSRLLRARRKRQDGNCATDNTEEIPPPHVHLEC